MKLKYFPLFCLGFAALCSQAGAGDLKVTVNGVERPEGYIRMALYGNARDFRDEDDAITLREAVADGASATFVVPSLPAGDYAVMVYHDRDRDHHFDHMMGLFAAEGYGLSNDAAVITGERFEDAAFQVPASGVAEIIITLRYCDSDYASGRPLSKTMSCWVSLSP